MTSVDVPFSPTGVQTGEAIIRVTNGAKQDSSDPFSIITQPGNIVANICPPNLASVVWDAVPGATSYDVFLLGTTHMDSVD